MPQFIQEAQVFTLSPCLLQTVSGDHKRITCPPRCRKAAIVPAGVEEFDNAFIINHMVDQLILNIAHEDEAEIECDECFRCKPIGTSLLFSFLCHDYSDYHKYMVEGFKIIK